jgi:hypothetical protein
MRKYDSSLKNLAFLAYRWLNPIVDPLRLLRSVPAYAAFFRDWVSYSRLGGAERLRLIDTYPCLYDKTPTTPFDSHYFYQDLWAFRKIVRSGVRSHVDIGSSIDLVGFLTVVCKVTFIDIRPLTARLENLESKKGSVLAIPCLEGAIGSLSCLHVAEHIGLGRYGDQLDPLGTQKACAELSRVLARDGNLYFALPVGKPRVCFNSHRIHSPDRILEYFKGLDLVELSGIDDAGVFRENIDVSILEKARYACGLFHFTKK